MFNTLAVVAAVRLGWTAHRLFRVRGGCECLPVQEILFRSEPFSKRYDVVRHEGSAVPI